jgi:hypothetical protein
LFSTMHPVLSKYSGISAETLSTLNASKYLQERGRLGFEFLPRTVGVDSNHSFESTEIALLKDALLMVVAALPIGALDDQSDDKFGKSFLSVWRAAVGAATDAAFLMNCQIVLEFGLKSAWLKPAGLKMFTSLPSRGHALRNATIGAVAIRLWLLDQCIRYEKLLEPKDTEVIKVAPNKPKKSK